MKWQDKISNLKNTRNSESDMVGRSAHKQEMAMVRTCFETGTKQVTESKTNGNRTDRGEEKDVDPIGCVQCRRKLRKVGRNRFENLLH